MSPGLKERCSLLESLSSSSYLICSHPPSAGHVISIECLIQIWGVHLAAGFQRLALGLNLWLCKCYLVVLGETVAEELLSLRNLLCFKMTTQGKHLNCIFSTISLHLHHLVNTLYHLL